jgi:type VI secretion system protein ImpK
LKPQEDRGALTVTEKGRESIVTLPSSADVFASGSADINPEYEATLEQIALALNKVKGRVTIVGHTDSQPIKSFRYQNNYQLSRERAASVATVLKRTLTPPGSLDVQGKGDSQRLVEESTPENRARNRRVEIIHIR